jgi:hypothetical protein
VQKRKFRFFLCAIKFATLAAVLCQKNHERSKRQRGAEKKIRRKSRTYNKRKKTKREEKKNSELLAAFVSFVEPFACLLELGPRQV